MTDLLYITFVFSFSIDLLTTNSSSIPIVPVGTVNPFFAVGATSVRIKPDFNANSCPLIVAAFIKCKEVSSFMMFYSYKILSFSKLFLGSFIKIK